MNPKYTFQNKLLEPLATTRPAGWTVRKEGIAEQTCYHRSEKRCNNVQPLRSAGDFVSYAVNIPQRIGHRRVQVAPLGVVMEEHDRKHHRRKNFWVEFVHGEHFGQHENHHCAQKRRKSFHKETEIYGAVKIANWVEHL